MNRSEFGDLITALKLARVAIKPDGSLVETENSRLTPALRAHAEAPIARLALSRLAQQQCHRCGAPLLWMYLPDEDRAWCSVRRQHFDWRRIVHEQLPDGGLHVTHIFASRQAERLTPLGAALRQCLNELGMVEDAAGMIELTVQPEFAVASVLVM